MKTERRFLTEDGPEVFTGNELLVKGALETEGGVHLLGGYPGSPISGYFDSLSVLKDVLTEKGIRAIINNNEALSAAMLNGTQTLPVRAMIGMKSVGVHVAADALALGNLGGAHKDGGAVLVCGDDPWSDSTQVPSDSRFLSKHLFMPVVEPSNPQEVKDFINLSFKISGRSELFISYILGTNLADGGGSVECSENHYPKVNMNAKIDLATKRIELNKRALLPPKTWWREEAFTERFARAIKAARELGLNRIDHPAAPGEKKPLGFIASGMAHDYLVQALYEMGVLGECPILKFGMSYPMDGELVEQLASQCERIIVVEERRGFMEEQAAAILTQARQEGRVDSAELYGKKFPGGKTGLPATRGLDPSILIRHLGPLVKQFALNGDATSRASQAIDRELEILQATEQVQIDANVPPRLPTFCPGCPHRDSSSLCLDIKGRFMNPQYMKKHHDSGPVDLLFHGDTGCYSMLMFPPTTELMHDFSGMGLGGGTGSGTDPFVSNKEVVFMGDSTFFHSGQLAISQAVKNQQDITFIILENSTTAMTGHQPTPGVDYDLQGNPTPLQDIETVVRGIASGAEVALIRVNPEKRDEYKELLEKTFLDDGVKVIVATKECSITRNRRKKRIERKEIQEKGFLSVKQYMNINPEICRFCLACVETTGCPGLRHVPTDYGMKMDTDISWCVDDGACERMGACDSFERIKVYRKNTPKSKVPELGLDEIPEPRKRPVGDVWRCCLTGVGGMGIGLATSILVRAGHNEGYKVIFLDKKGMAIRNGGVVSQVLFNIAKEPITAIMSHGKADLLLGVDILEAARVLDPASRVRVASKEKTAAVINTDKIATISGLMGRKAEDYDPAELEELIRSNTREDEFLARNISKICEKYLGSKLYANIMMMGYAFQQGLIPVSKHSIAWAIKDAIRVDFQKNLYAFNMGRKLVEQPDLFQGVPVKTGWKETLDEKCLYTTRRYGKKSPHANELRGMLDGAIEKMQPLDETLKRDIVVRAYDCMRWGGMSYAQRYVDQVAAAFQADRPEYNWELTKAVVHNLASAMLIKDGIFKAELATSKEKYRRDHEKYNINRANGDFIRYRYLWKRDIGIGPWKTRWNLPMGEWQLKTLKRMRWLRPLMKLSGWHRLKYRHLKNYEAKLADLSYKSAEEYTSLLGRISSPQCMSCITPSCSKLGCPLENEIPVWTRLANEGNWKEALASLQSTNNFPEFTSQICPAFCQDACHRSHHDYPVQVQEMERKIVEKGFAKGWIKPQKAKTASGKSVAIVGSGPAGLTAAQQLARAGHDVTVYEKDNAPGGLLRYGIPEPRLAKKLIDRRIEQLEAEGVKFVCGQAVGKDVTADELHSKFDAICLAGGAAAPRKLNIEGQQRKGIVNALDFLRQQNIADATGKPVERSVAGKAVAVIGGGLTGEDCVETALRQGAKQVVQLEILPRPLTAPQPHGENVTQHWSVMAKAFEGQNGQLESLKVAKVKYTPSATGPVMSEQADGEFDVQADLAVIAAGFLPQCDENIATQLGLELDASGKIVTNENFGTSVDGVFAAGDQVTGAAYVVTAIDSGRQAATQVDDYLKRS